MNKHTHIILDMDSTLLSMECLDTVIETALSAQLHPDAIKEAMDAVNAEMDKGMSGAATLKETIPARIAIAKRLGAPVRKEHFSIVANIVPNTLTQTLVEALLTECTTPHKYPIRVSVVSGGPQVCVDAAVSALEKHMRESAHDARISFLGFGNTISVTPEGDFDQVHSEIENSKIERVRSLIEDPAHSIMIGDGATDVELYDSGIVNYFIALGVWVRRPVLFDRNDNPPHYIKVDRHDALPTALHTAIHATQE